MADIAIQTMLIRLLFKQEEAQYIVNNEGLDAIDKMGCLDDEMLDHMCKSCRKAPVLDEPLAQATWNAAANRAPLGGHAIGVIQENALKNAVFYVQYKDMTSRQANPEEITLKSLELVRDFKKSIYEMKSSSLDEALKLTTKRAFEFFDEFKGCSWTKTLELPQKCH